jgi:hypothetical protein
MILAANVRRLDAELERRAIASMLADVGLDRRA